MEALQQIWQYYTNYIAEFNTFQKAVIGIIISFIIVASVAAVVFLIMEIA